MNKTIKQAERYETPCSRVITVTIQGVIAQSVVEEPIGTGTNFDDPTIE